MIEESYCIFVKEGDSHKVWSALDIHKTKTRNSAVSSSKAFEHVPPSPAPDPFSISPRVDFDPVLLWLTSLLLEHWAFKINGNLSSSSHALDWGHVTSSAQVVPGGGAWNVRPQRPASQMEAPACWAGQQMSLSDGQTLLSPALLVINTQCPANEMALAFLVSLIVSVVKCATTFEKKKV